MDKPANWLANRKTALLWASAILLMGVLTAWTMLTPEGVLGKADAIGYAVCHRIPERSFTLPDGRPLAMCARCTGTFLGVMIGLLLPGLLLGRRRAGGFPKAWIMVVLVAFSGWWAFDGFNSFNHLLPESFIIPRLFPPNNFLRMTTGTLHGITLGSVILPIFNATIWQDATEERTLESPLHLLALVGVGVTVIALVVSEIPVFLVPASLLSAVGTVTILTATASVLVASLFGMENEALTLGEALPVIVLALALTFILVGSIDAARFLVFGTWDGFIVQ